MRGNELILFVCSGNTCRSAMAEAYAVSLGLRAFSRGTLAENGKPMNPYAVKALSRAGIPVNSAHRAKLVSEKDVRRADVVLCMDTSHLEELIWEFPEQSTKVRLLKGNQEIEDPFGSDQGVYDWTFDEIRTGVDDYLSGKGGQSNGTIRSRNAAA